MITPIPLLTALIPTLGMLSGLTASFTVTLLLIALLLKSRGTLSFSIKDYKLETLFLIWCFICCFVTPNPMKSLTSFLEVFFFIVLGLVLKNKIAINNDSQIKIEKAVFYGIAAAVILFFIEYFSQGMVFRNFRNIFQSDSPSFYQLNSLDRGCALLSISSWIVIANLLNSRKYVQVLCFYGLVFLVLYLSDSLASLIGFILAGLLLIFGRFISTKFFKVATILTLIGSILFPITVHKIDPYKTSEEYSEVLPDSAKHRLFIWHFVSERLEHNSFTGAGFAASRQFVASDKEMIEYRNYHWSPLPLHPHSNVLQILFETGIIGFVLFMSIVLKNLRKVEDLVKSNINFGSASYACFVNYYVIGMISFSIWQAWWVATAVWAVVMLNIVSKKLES